MILHALTRHYEDLLSLGRIPRPGWGTAKVSYALDLSLEGEILALLPLKTEQLRGKKRSFSPARWKSPCLWVVLVQNRKRTFCATTAAIFSGWTARGTPNGPASVLRPQGSSSGAAGGPPLPGGPGDHRIFPPMGPPDGLPTPGPRRELEGSDGRGQPGFLGGRPGGTSGPGDPRRVAILL